MRSGATVVDATVGLGGHAALLLEQIGPTGLLIGLDLDERNLLNAGQVLGRWKNVRLFHENFSNIERVLKESNVTTADAILADLGVSSNQIEDASRGFSFMIDGPLDMRLDRRQATTAEDLVNRLGEAELADLIYQHGQERASRRIARRIHQARRTHRIRTSGQLAEIICSALGQSPVSHKRKIHPATRTFMALRIAVNDELTNLKLFLDALPRVLHPGGRAAMISFHSLEDGLCKRAFKAMKDSGLARILTKSPVTADQEERRKNPRARSAKLRVVERL